MTAARPTSALMIVLCAASSAAAQQALPVEVEIDGRAGTPSAEDIRGAIGRELGVEAVDGAVVPGTQAGVQVRVRDGVALVKFVASDGAAVSRSIELPADDGPATEAIALLAGNLGRRQADALLSELLAARRQVIVIEAEEPPSVPVLVPPPSEPGPPVESEAPATEKPPVPATEEPLPIRAQAPVPEQPLPALEPAPFYVSFVPGLSTDRGAEAERSHGLALGLPISAGGGLQGAAVAAVADVRLRRVDGVQVAGAAAVALGELRGAQVSGAFNLASGPLRGAQVTGGVNLAVAGELRGAQVSGAFNLASGRLRGVQATGGVNLALDRVSLQVAPVNVSERADVQLGVVNVAERADFQLGVVNVATEARVPIGLLNIVTDGRTDIEAWGETTGGVFAAVRHGGTVTHNLYGAGVIIRRDTRWVTLGFGVGGRIPLEIGAIDIDAMGWHLTESQHLTSGLSLLAQVRATLAIDIAPPLALIAGVVENTFLSNHEDAPDLAVGPSWGSTEGDVTLRSWLSLFAGVRVH